MCEHSKRVMKKGGEFDDNNDDIGGGRDDNLAQEDVGRRERRDFLRFRDDRGRRRLLERFMEIARLLARSFKVHALYRDTPWERHSGQTLT